MRRQVRAAAALMFAVSALWFGGLFRLIGEGLARILPVVVPTESDQRTLMLVIICGAVTGVVEIALLWRWTSFRRAVRQGQGDIRSLYGVPASAAPPVGQASPRTVISAVVVLVSGLVLAALLPGIEAAVLALVAGLVFRVAVVVFMMAA